jgi:hypothetical protein
LVYDLKGLHGLWFKRFMRTKVYGLKRFTRFKRGLWFKEIYGLKRFMVYVQGLWFMFKVYGLCTFKGLWFMFKVYGLCTFKGLWFMFNGLWFKEVYGIKRFMVYVQGVQRFMVYVQDVQRGLWFMYKVYLCIMCIWNLVAWFSLEPWMWGFIV